MKDVLYFPRTALAAALLDNLSSGIAHAFTLFAPRRMGKTAFLLNDVEPLAKQKGFNVFYFSFMDNQQGISAAQYFHTSLYQFSQAIQSGNGIKSFLGSLNKIEILGVSAERETESAALPSISAIIATIANDNAPSVLLLDEIQELARLPDTDGLIKSLRTGLDIHQNRVKTIFTGSSTNGLRAMFNDVKAPFFHFSHALDFPPLGQEFTDFLAEIYQQRTGNTLDKAELFAAFEELHKTPLYIRSAIQDMIINPDLPLNIAVQNRKTQMQEHSDFPRLWQQLTALERLLLQHIAQKHAAPYSEAFKQQAATVLGVESVKTSSVQSAIRRLERQELITRHAGTIKISNGILQTWLNENA